jgi:hypothetical protein
MKRITLPTTRGQFIILCSKPDCDWS